MKASLLISVLVCSLMVCVDAMSQTKDADVISIPEVVVSESNSSFFSEDQITISVDQHLLSISRQQNLGTVLSYKSPAIVRSYGSQGSLMSLSLHGTGSNHTSVSWNGFPINSPTTGQADLSLVPFGFMQSVDIVHGASGALNGSGTFGGLVELRNEPDWNNKISADFSIEAASFHTQGYYLSAKAGGQKLQYHISVLQQKALNDFTYEDVYKTGAPEVEAIHNAYKSSGLIQNLYYNAGNGHFVEAGAWFQYKLKETPPLMGSYKQSNAEQVDHNFRTYLNYRKTFIHSSLLIKTAFFTDCLHYTDKADASDADYSVNSKIDVKRFLSGVEYRHYISSVITAGTGGSYVHHDAVTNNYSDEINENEVALYGNLKVKWNDWIINTSVRQEFYEEINPALQYSLGFRVKVNDRMVLRSNLSNKFRKPTLNEKYWRPGGNPELNPEKGWGGDLAVELNMLKSAETDAECTVILSGYYQCIDNWIQWIMHDSLTPVEYKKVHSRGVEVIMDFYLPAGHLDFSGSINYGCNIATISETYDDNELLSGNQLVYIPRHVARLNLNVLCHGITLSCNSSFTGSRETVESADSYARLPAYGLVDLMLGYDFQFKKVHAGLLFQVENLLDQQYEVMRSYAMPGRAFHLTLTTNFYKP